MAHIEALAIRMGVQLASNIRHGPFLFECDFVNIVHAINRSCEDSSLIGPVIEDCKAFLSSLFDFKVIFAPRCCNCVANRQPNLAPISIILGGRLRLLLTV